VAAIISRRDAEELILKTYRQFSEPLVHLYQISRGNNVQDAREIQKIYQNYIEAVGAVAGSDILFHLYN
jgi:hypothetical protein